MGVHARRIKHTNAKSQAGARFHDHLFAAATTPRVGQPAKGLTW
jgi:hypothetical protein